MVDQNNPDEERRRKEEENKRKLPPIDEEADTMVGGLPSTEIMPNGGAISNSGAGLVRPTSTHQFVGETVEQYLLEEGAHHGGQGAIYRCRIVDKDGNPIDDNPFALKLLEDIRHLENPDSYGRFKEEAHHLLAFEHPNIVRCIDAGDWERGGINYPFFVMEYITDPLVWSTVDVPMAMTLEMGQQMAEALDYVHARNRIHRDVKPDNILRSRSTGKTVLIDFGLGKLLEANLQGGVRPPTVAGVLLGTMNYMPYEQAADSKLANKWSDVYSLGATLWEWLTGIQPWSDMCGTNVWDVFAHLLRKESLQPPHEVNTPKARNIPPEVSKFVHEMVSPDYKARPTANQARHELAKLRGALQPGGVLLDEVYSPDTVVDDFENFLKKVDNLARRGKRGIALGVLKAGSAGHLHNIHQTFNDDAMYADCERRAMQKEIDITDDLQREGTFHVVKRRIESTMVDSENLRSVFNGQLLESLLNGDREIEELQRRVAGIEHAFEAELFTPELVGKDVYDAERERLDRLKSDIDSRNEELALGRYNAVSEGLPVVESSLESIETSYDEKRAGELADDVSSMEKLLARINPEYLTEDEDVEGITARVQAAREKLNTIRGVPAASATSSIPTELVEQPQEGAEPAALSELGRGILLFAERKFGDAQSCFRGIKGPEGEAASLYLEAIELEKRASVYPAELGQVVRDLRESIDSYRSGGSTSRVLKAMEALAVESGVFEKVRDLMANFGASKLADFVPGSSPSDTGRQRAAHVGEELFRELEDVYAKMSGRLEERNEAYTYLAGMYHRFAEEAADAGRRDLAAIYRTREGNCRGHIVKI